MVPALSADSFEGRSGVILALRGADEPKACLERAHRLALGLDQGLTVVRVLPSDLAPSSLSSVGVSGGKAFRLPHVDDATRRWLLGCLGSRADAVRVVVSTGEFVAQVGHCASHARARIVVISPGPSHAGNVATALARTSGSQVLIARSIHRQAPILAATDPQDACCPVLRSALEIATLLQQPLATFQLQVAERVMDSVRVPVIGAALPVSPRGSSRTERDPVHAILSEAAACEADMIVVGTHLGSGWRRTRGDGVSARVADQAERAVLVTPILEAPQPPSQR